MPLQSHAPRVSLFPEGYRFRLVAMVGALMLIGATIYSLRERARPVVALQAAEGPTGTTANVVGEPSGDGREVWQETIVHGLADDDPLEMEQARELFEIVLDAEKLQETDMSLYWRLLKWARSRSFSELADRARKVPLANLWREPQEHRGELIRLRLHIRRIVAWEQKGRENSAGVKTAYEITGFTDESMSIPYVVVCSELPPGMTVGSDVRVEGEFVGYFLKILKYAAGDERAHLAPLLFGRVKLVKSGKSAGTARSEELVALVAIGFAILLTGLFTVVVWRYARRKQSPIPVSAVSALPATDLEAWLENGPGGAVFAVASEVANGPSFPTVGPAAVDSKNHAK